MTIRPAALGLLLCLAASDAFAKDVADPGFLSPTQYEPARLLPPPPAPGSQTAQDEIVELKQFLALRTGAALADALRDDKDETGDVFAAAIGPGFDLAKLPATQKMLADIGATESVVGKDAKKYFHRPRPWIVIPSWTTCSEHKPGPAENSYPSGHSTVAYAMGVVLAGMIPDKAQAILGQSAAFAESRLVCGVHFRSDIVAGQVLGTIIATDLMQNADFRREYDAAAAELTAAQLR